MLFWRYPTLIHLLLPVEWGLCYKIIRTLHINGNEDCRVMQQPV